VSGQSKNKNAASFGWGALIGNLGGLIGLGGAEFRLPVLVARFRLPTLEAVILSKAMNQAQILLSKIKRSFARQSWSDCGNVSVHSNKGCTNVGHGAPCPLGDDNMEINFATAADLPDLADLLAELFTLESDFQPNRDKQLRGLRTILDEPELGKLFVLRVEGKVAGMANALLTISTAEGERALLLEDVIVRQEYRGRGFGRQLVEHVLEWAKRRGMVRVTLLADNQNKVALDFYQALGFSHSHMQVLRKSLT
jgi:GNAT superfamily N-acetyltransferase